MAEALATLSLQPSALEPVDQPILGLSSLMLLGIVHGSLAHPGYASVAGL